MMSAFKNLIIKNREKLKPLNNELNRENYNLQNLQKELQEKNIFKPCNLVIYISKNNRGVENV